METKNYIGEIWKPVIGYYGLYEVSNFGRVKSINYNKTGKERLMKQVVNKQGYYQVTLHKNGSMAAKKVHRLVAEAFIPNPNNLPCVNHKNEDKTDNRVENLEWCSIEYNNRYGMRGKKISEAISGENHYLYGKHHTQETVDKIRESVIKTKRNV